jgi:glycosyltransferase involved in cell wall biosynthesis
VLDIKKEKGTVSVALLVTDLDAPTGGVQKNSRLLLRAFGERGFPAFACVRNYYGLAKDEVMDGAMIHRSPVLGGSRAVNGVLYLVDTFRWLLRNRKKYNVIHCQQMFGPTMVAAVASYFLKRPIVTRITSTGHLGEVKAIREMPLAWLRLRLIRRVSRWVVLTRAMGGELESLGIPRERIRIIYNGTNLPESAAYLSETRDEMRKGLSLSPGKIGVFVGRLSSEKNLDILIAAWKNVRENHPDAQLLLLGAGGEYRNVESSLRELVNELGMTGAVHFLGHVDNAKDYILASDVFILPSSAEGMSNALVEAFACGVPIVATNIEANTELCEDRVNSLLVPVGDVEQLDGAVSTIFESREFADRLARAARKKAEERLSTKEMISSYLDVYREAIQQP